MKLEETDVSGLRTRVFCLGDMIVGVPVEIGPRVIYLAHKNRPDLNLFGVLPEAGVQTPEGFWRIYGGHRLWSSPEAKPRSYSIDDKPVEVTLKGDCVTISGNPEAENAIQKRIKLGPFSESCVEVTHTIRNLGRWPIKLACWALSVMRQKGFAIVPIKASKVDEEGLLPDRHLATWPYSRLSDRRLVLTDEYVFVKQDVEAATPLKIGTMANPSWAAYWVDGLAFVKEFRREKGEYPDFGCSVEVYTNPTMLELETLGPLRTLMPSEDIKHTETWRILQVGHLAPEPKSIDSVLEPLLEKRK